MSTAADEKLIIRFFNVGDGDSALLERLGEKPFRLLVDAGSSLPEALDGGCVCAEYLRTLGVSRLDAVIITHLHLDHMGGLKEIAETIPIRRVISGYFPPDGAGTIPQEPQAEKTVRGLINCLNVWKEITDLLQRQGCALEEIRESGPLTGLGPGLKMACVSPDPPGMERQKRAWDSMFRGEMIPDAEKPPYPGCAIRRPSFSTPNTPGASWRWGRTASGRFGKGGTMLPAIYSRYLTMATGRP